MELHIKTLHHFNPICGYQIFIYMLHRKATCFRGIGRASLAQLFKIKLD